MKLAASFQALPVDQVTPLLDGGVLKIYSVARPVSPDAPITQSGLLVTFRFGSPAVDASGPTGVVFVENTVSPSGVGTPGFARAYSADGTTPIADFSVGPGDTDITLSEVSTTPGYPISVVRFKL
jgi:hypothetical protein